MEFDIPLPEELELLEANSHFYEEEEDDYLNFEEPPYPYPIDGDEEKEEERLAQKEPHVQRSESIDINGCKRPRNVISDPMVNLDEVSPAFEKRSKIDNNRVEIEDEDWLRFSPVKEVVHVMEEEEEVEVIPQEIILSRLLYCSRNIPTSIFLISYLVILLLGFADTLLR